MSDLKRKKGIKLFLCLLPGLIYVFVFSYLPLWGLGYAFVEYVPGRKFLDSEFVGFNNFTMLFGNPILRKNIFQSLINTLGMNFLEIAIMPLNMMFAIFLSELPGRKFKKVVQTASTLPHFISWVIMFSLATCLLSTTGLVNSVLMDIGMIEKPINILTTDKHVWITQTLITIWKGMGWSSIVYFAAIAGIDQEQYDAAKVDGAGRMARIRYITIPHLIPTYIVLLVMQIGSMLSTGYDRYYIFRNAMNEKYITTFDLYIFNLGIGNGEISLGTAVGGMKSIVAIILFSTANYISKRIRGQGIA